MVNSGLKGLTANGSLGLFVYLFGTPDCAWTGRFVCHLRQVGWLSCMARILANCICGGRRPPTSESLGYGFDGKLNYCTNFSNN